MKEILPELQAFDEYLTLKNFSKSTRKSYRCALKQFLLWRVKNGYLGQLDQQQARAYILQRYAQNLKWQTINGDYSALMKYFRYVKKITWNIDHIPRPRKERSLPRIIAIEDVEKIIAHAASLKQQTFMCLLYATGIRLSEALNLEVSHIDGKRKQILIKRGKGAKDRYVDLPEKMLFMLRHYYKMYRPQKYLFYGNDRTQQLAPRSAQHILQVAAKKAGINKNVSPHTFRHSYATHHLENGTDLVYLQQQMGHKHLKTTAKYIHLMQSQSWRINHPIVKLQIEYHPKIT